MRNHIYVLIHSPLVGSLTWALIADELQQRGYQVVVPGLKDSPDSQKPFWKQHAESVAQALAEIAEDDVVTLVAHSGAGPLLPVIRQSIPNQVKAYVFVDAGIPQAGASRLDLMKAENPDWAKQFEETLKGGGSFPNWSSDDLHEIIPDDSLRQQLVAEIQPRRWDFFTEPVPVFDEWPDAPCIYILFSDPYKTAAAHARQAGWPTYEVDAGHLHMLVNAPAVTDIITKAVGKFV